MREIGGQNEKRNYFNNTVMLRGVMKDEQNFKNFYYRLNSLWHFNFNIA
jgi:hypothetical protein